MRIEFGFRIRIELAGEQQNQIGPLQTSAAFSNIQAWDFFELRKSSASVQGKIQNKADRAAQLSKQAQPAPKKLKKNWNGFFSPILNKIDDLAKWTLKIPTKFSAKRSD